MTTTGSDQKKELKPAADTFKLDKDDKILLYVVGLGILGGAIYMFLK